MNDMPNPSLGILTFTIFTIIYCISKYYYTTYGNRNDLQINDDTLLAVYVGIIGISQYLANLNISSYMCDEPQLGIVFTSTIIPFVCVFGILIIILKLNPNFYGPFENTFGYLILLMTGFSSFVKDKLFKSEPDDTDKALSVIKRIYEDMSVFVNEISSSNSDDVFITLASKVNEVDPNGKSNKEVLWQYVRIKEITSQFIWFMLTGLLVSTISYNYIINQGCKLNAKQLKINQEEASKNNRETEAKTDTRYPLYEENEYYYE